MVFAKRTTPADNIHVVLSFDGVPKKQRAKYLESRCGIPEVSALRLLRGIDPVLPETRKALAAGLDISERWLTEGDPDSDRVRDLEIWLVLNGYPISDAKRLFKLRQDLLNEDPDAERIFNLWRPNGVYPLTAAAKLYDEHLEATRLKLVAPEPVAEADLSGVGKMENGGHHEVSGFPE